MRRDFFITIVQLNLIKAQYGLYVRNQNEIKF